MDKPVSFKEVNHRARFEGINSRLPEEGFLRLWQIVGGKGHPALIPISKSAWWKGIREGRFPKPVKLGKKTSLWPVESIRSLIER
jgi:predicted DNA-binding transcriptional regulator AlpA